MNISTKFEFDNVLTWLYFKNNNWEVCRWPAKCMNIIIRPTADDSVLYEFIDEFDNNILIPEKDVFIDGGLACVECRRRNKNKYNEIIINNNIIKVGEKYKCKTDDGIELCEVRSITFQDLGHFGSYYDIFVVYEFEGDFEYDIIKHTDVIFNQGVK